LRGRRIHASREKLVADSTRLSDTDTAFDGTYRHLLRAAKAKAKFLLKVFRHRRSGNPANTAKFHSAFLLRRRKRGGSELPPQ
jgi:hypothetical protein